MFLNFLKLFFQEAWVTKNNSDNKKKKIDDEIKNGFVEDVQDSIEVNETASESDLKVVHLIAWYI